MQLRIGVVSTPGLRRRKVVCNGRLAIRRPGQDATHAVIGHLGVAVPYGMVKSIEAIRIDILG